MAEGAQSDNPRRLLGCLVLIFAVIVLLTVIDALTPDKPGSQRISAKIMARDFIKDQLRAPSTADFGGETTTYLGDEIYRVMGYVDAQNMFGAKIRSHWVCTVQETTKDKWTQQEPCGLLD